MKKIIYAGLALSFSLLFTSCGDDFLDKQPHDNIASTTFWKTPAQAEEGLAGVYDALQSPKRELGWGTFPFFDGLTILSDSRDGKFNEVARGYHTPTSGFVGQLWKQSYRGVVRANEVLTRVDDVPFSDESQKTRIKAEARYLRSMFYFHLADNYGGVALFEHVPTLDDITVPRSSVDEVIALMIEDLDFAIQYLPVKAHQVGRATKGAAYTMKAKVAMLKKDWATAEAATAEVMKLDYALESDYKRIFALDNENNGEVIFDIQYIGGEDGEGNVVEKLLGNRAMGVSGWSWMVPSFNLVEYYEVIDENPTYEVYAPLVPEKFYTMLEGRDPRMDATILRPGATFLNKVGEETVYPNIPAYTHSESGLHIRKNVIEGGPDLTLPEKGPLNLILLRYADVLLMHLEAKANQGGIASVDQATLDATINKIRKRASDKLPLYTAGDIEMEDVYKEYIRELAMEGWMYSNFKRWKWLEKAHGMTTKDVQKVGDGIDFIEDNPVREFEAPKDYLFPIPASEIEKSNGWAQNPGW
ncbi:glycan metabolism protein RagB [Fulvitalea axinellae]|uniref:Glycan metabolism protein RagB n=1 Tax=Fulvitalea axinellae TaxID=1182444 RepID=A0AAU9C920_9BACT|nr:glycan metabolism protein RagB [Fulvitalea axinellae]